MPMVGYSIDRRTFHHLKADMSEDAVRSLVCMMCAQVRMTTNSANSQIDYINYENCFHSISGTTSVQSHVGRVRARLS